MVMHEQSMGRICDYRECVNYGFPRTLARRPLYGISTLATIQTLIYWGAQHAPDTAMLTGADTAMWLLRGLYRILQVRLIPARPLLLVYPGESSTNPRGDILGSGTMWVFKMARQRTSRTTS